MTQYTIYGGTIETGKANSVGVTINRGMFGGHLTGFRPLENFLDAINFANSHLIRWPGGTLSENANSWYGLDFPDLIDPARPREGLSDVLRVCVESNRSLSILIPTVRYGDDLETAQLEVSNFVEKLASGMYGTLPREVILEIGNEYYAQDIFKNDPTKYGIVANFIVQTISNQLTSIGSDAFSSTIKIAVQGGNTISANKSILAEFSQTALRGVNFVIDHEYPPNFASADDHHLNNVLSLYAWKDAGANSDVALFLSEWNVESWTRAESSEKYVELMYKNWGIVVDPTEINLRTRTNDDFENFWQTGTLVDPDGAVIITNNGLNSRDYGPKQSSTLLEIFSYAIKAGATRAATYGFDLQYPGAVSSEDFRYIGADLLRMMEETLIGTRELGAFLENYRETRWQNPVNVHAFEDSAKVVIFLSADDLGTFDSFLYKFSVEGGLSGYRYGWAESLTSSIPYNWMELHNIVDNPNVDESAEAETFSEGHVTQYVLNLQQNQIQVKFTDDYQVVRIVLVKDKDSYAPLYIAGDKQDRTLVGNFGNDRMVGGSGNETIIGRMGNDSIEGGPGRDTLFGRLGNDSLQGGAQDDVLFGGAGQDLLSGGARNDRLWGGVGRDTFVFLPRDGIDVISDFLNQIDKIDLTAFDGVKFEDIIQNAEQFGTSVVIRFDSGDSLTINHFALSKLSVDDFVF